MIYPSLAFLFSAAVFLAVIVTLALRPASTHRVISVVVMVTAVLGLAFYGFGYGMAADSPQEAFVAACRAIFSTTFMFAGRENYSTLCSIAPWFADSAGLQIVFWLAHMAAMYATASTVFSTIGIRLLRVLRTLTLPLCRVCLLYGSGNAAAAKELSEKGLRPVLVAEQESDELEQAADAAGGVFWTAAQVGEDGAWLRRLGIRPGGRRLEILCLNGDDGQTMEFLANVVAALSAGGIVARQIHICVVCQSEANFDFLSRTELKSGSHLAADVYSSGCLAAMRLVDEAPPCRAVRFDAAGSADADFCAMIIGFGSIGQNVLRQLVRSGQFNGSSFSAIVVDRDLDGCSGSFRSLYGDLIERYNVSFVQADARSEGFVKLLDEASKRLRYVAVCTGDGESDRRIANQLCSYRLCRSSRFSPRMVLAVCGRDTVTILGGKARRSASDGESGRGREMDLSFPVMRMDDLLEGRPDAMARAVNAIYLRSEAMRRWPEDERAREDFYRDGWYAMGDISRASCRAAAAAIPAMLAAAGAEAGNRESLGACLSRLETDGDFLDVLSRMEHLRWNAFQSSAGVTRMPEKEFQRRIAAALDCGENALEALAAMRRPEAEGRAEMSAQADRACDAFRAAMSRARKEIPGFGVGGIHACLCDWDELPALWEDYVPLALMRRKIERLRAGSPDADAPESPEDVEDENFQRLDSNNVLGILQWLVGEAE